MATVLGLAAILSGCAPGRATIDDIPGLREVVRPSYEKVQSVWPQDALEHPARDARVDGPVSRDLPNVVSLRRLAIGMTEEQVLFVLGEPADRGPNRRWQYLAQDADGLFAATLWFNDEGRLWMAATNVAPAPTLSARARAALAPVRATSPQQPGA